MPRWVQLEAAQACPLQRPQQQQTPCSPQWDPLLQQQSPCSRQLSPLQQLVAYRRCWGLLQHLQWRQVQLQRLAQRPQRNHVQLVAYRYQ